MERRRIPYERERWLSAVLIVTAIAGASMVVPRWPLAVVPAPRVVPHLSARFLPLIDPPGALISASLPQRRPSSPGATGAPVTAAPPAVAAVLATDMPRPESPVSASPAVAAGGGEPQATALLASRRVELAGDFHPLPDDDLLASSSSSSHPFVELPAVVVTRAVMVAGRGIRTGLRATSAMFRAAF